MTPRPREARRGNPRARGAAAGVAVALIAVFLSASLAPCPPPARVGPAHAEPTPECHEQTAATFVKLQCPCRCGEHAPVAGSSARVGVALPSSAPDLAPRLAAELARFAPVRFDAGFAAPIDHIPLAV